MISASGSEQAYGPARSSRLGRSVQRLWRFSIPVRLAALSVLLLLALIATNLFLVRELNENSNRISATTDLFRHLETANAASMAFANMRYWLTDLAVSLLTISERNPERSEEHTSELQSLMRLSYAVFCLKKKQKKTQNN